MLDHIEDHNNVDAPGKKLSEDIAHFKANKNNKGMRVLFSKMSPRKLQNANEDLISADVMERTPQEISANVTPDPLILSNQAQDGDEE